jgi:hypothetical protein
MEKSGGESLQTGISYITCQRADYPEGLLEKLFSVAETLLTALMNFSKYENSLTMELSTIQEATSCVATR